MKTHLYSVIATLAVSLSPVMAADSVLTIPLKDIDGKDTTLADLKAKAFVIVNVASECGYTSQYAGLQELHEKMKDAGVAVLGFPCNDFGGQEPGTESEIKAFCTGNYSVTFPMFSKVKITGDDKHPLFESITGKTSPQPGTVGWNFEKFVVAGDGTLIARFGSDTEPNDPALMEAIEKALAK